MIVAMIENIKNHIQEVNAFTTDNKEALEQFRIKYLSKKGILNDFFAEFKNVPNENKKNSDKLSMSLKKLRKKK